MSRARLLIACLASLIAPGAGHFLLGAWAPGLVFVVVAALGHFLGWKGAVTGRPVLIGAFVVLMIALRAAALVDVVRRRRAATPGPVWKVVLAWIGVLGLSRAEAAAVRAFVVETFKSPGASMEPAVLRGDHFFVDKSARDPKKGDVVVFTSPKNGQDYIKRVVAVGGDVVSVDDGMVVLDRHPIAQKLDQPCRYEVVDEASGTVSERPCRAMRETVDGRSWITYLEPQSSRAYPALKVPEGHVWVLGDNRDNSYDSRWFGPVPVENVKGRATWIWWSSDKRRIGRVIE